MHAKLVAGSVVSVDLGNEERSFARALIPPLFVRDLSLVRLPGFAGICLGAAGEGWVWLSRDGEECSDRQRVSGVGQASVRSVFAWAGALGHRYVVPDHCAEPAAHRSDPPGHQPWYRNVAAVRPDAAAFTVCRCDARSARGPAGVARHLRRLRGVGRRPRTNGVVAPSV
jgi:hypothetical protein